MTEKTDSIKILIAEDDPFLGKIIYNQLKNLFEVDKAEDGVAALEKVRNNAYDFILLDLVMPNKDGFEVLEELRKNKNRVPVYVFSNLSQEREKKRAFALGAKGFYVKSEMELHDIKKLVMSFVEKRGG